MTQATTPHVSPPPAISVILYTRDDEAALPAALADLEQVLAGLGVHHEVIVVDDGSTDGTAAIAEEACLRHPAVRLLRLAPRGPVGRPQVGAAFRQALALARHPLLLQMDARDPLDPAALTALVDRLNECDIAIGRRRGRPRSLRARLAYWFFRRFCRIVFGIPLSDVNCPLRLYRAEVFGRVRVQSDGEFADAEIIAKAGFYGFQLDEVPVGSRSEGWWRRDLGRGWLKGVLREAWAVFRRPVLLPAEAGGEPPLRPTADTP